MLRNALRQSNRAVGAVSASGRAATVSLTNLGQNPKRFLSIALSSNGRTAPVKRLRIAKCLRLTLIRGLLTSLPRPEKQHPQFLRPLRIKHEATLSMQKHLQQKSRRSWSKGFGEYKRKPVLPKQGVFYQSGIFNLLKQVTDHITNGVV